MTDEKTAREITLNAMLEIYGRTRKPVSREALINFTGLPSATIDWQLRVMREKCVDIVRAGDGGYVPFFKHPADRAMSFSPLDHGLIKFEIGDSIPEIFTPGEASKVGVMFAGYVRPAG